MRDKCPIKITKLDQKQTFLIDIKSVLVTAKKLLIENVILLSENGNFSIDALYARIIAMEVRGILL